MNFLKETFGARTYAAKGNNAFAEILAATEHLIAVQAKHESNLDRLNAYTYNKLDQSDEFLKRTGENILLKLEGKKGETPSRLRQAVFGAAGGIYATMTTNEATIALRQKIDQKLNKTLRGIANEIGDGALTKEMIEQLLYVKVNISKARQQAETFTMSWFNGNKKEGIEGIWKSVKQDGMDAKTKAWGLQSSSSAGSSQGSIMSMEDKYELLNVRAIRTEIIVALIPGCMDANSPNYDPTATQNDGSCIGIGDTYEGGTIFYLDGTGGGMVVHPGNVGGVEQWGDTNHTVGTSDLVGSGAANTAAIIAHATANSYTAAASLTVGTFNNFSDWYLPSKEEVQAIFTNLPTATIQGWISTFPVWSSTEHFNNTSHRAYARNTNQTTPYGYAKTVGLYVMPIRNF